MPEPSLPRGLRPHPISITGGATPPGRLLPCAGWRR